jgi:hypothetical protein
MNYSGCGFSWPASPCFVACVARPASAQVDYEAYQPTRQLPIERAAAAITLDGAIAKVTYMMAF